MSKTAGKTHDQNSAVFDGLVALSFDTIATLDINQANTTVQGKIGLGLNFKCFIISISATTIGNTGLSDAVAFNIVRGFGTETGVVPPNDNSELIGYPATTANAGDSMFATDKALTIVSGSHNTPSTRVIIPDNPDSIWPAGSSLTLRFVTNGTGASTGVKVTMYGKFYDNNPTKGSSNTFDFSTSLNS